MAVLVIQVAPAGAGAIEGYASATSVAQGDALDLHVSTAAATFDVQIEDAIDTGIVLGRIEGLAGAEHAVPDSAFANGCGWPVAITVPIDADWPSGVYYARLEAPSIPDTAYVPFVVREDQPGSTSDILFQCSFNTYQAYNGWGGRSLYPQHPPGAGERSYWVSFDRPFDEEDGRGQFPWWERPMAAWLRSEGIAVEFCTNVDLHLDPALVSHYGLFLSVGHDEYWSKEMFDQVEAFRDAGGSLAWFSGNSVFWAVRFDQGGRRMICYKDYTLDPYYQLGLYDRVTDNWRDYPLNRPEAALIGVAFDSWCWRPCGAPILPREVHHWVTRGLDLEPFEPIGEAIVGYEWDGVTVDSPPARQIVFRSPISNAAGEPHLQVSTYYEYPGEPVGPPSCRVFAAGTIQWSHGLEGPAADPRFQALTRRLIRCLRAPERIATDRTVVFRLDLSGQGPAPEALVWLFGRTAPLSTTQPAQLRDDGAWPDTVAGDGVFAVAVDFPAATWAIVEYWYETTDVCTPFFIHKSAWIDDPETVVDGVAYPSVDAFACPPAASVGDPASTGSAADPPTSDAEAGGDGVATANGVVAIRTRSHPRGVLVRVELGAGAVGEPLRVAIYGVNGRLVRVLLDGAARGVAETLVWDGRDAAGRRVPRAGYFIRAESAGRALAEKTLWLD